MSRTGNPPSRPRCALERMMPQSMDVEDVKRRAWQEEGILVIALDDEQLSWDERETLRQLGEKKHGKCRR